MSRSLYANAITISAWISSTSASRMSQIVSSGSRPRAALISAMLLRASSGCARLSNQTSRLQSSRASAVMMLR
jgi:hypothetical protein